MGKNEGEWRAGSERGSDPQEADDVGCCPEKDRSRATRSLGEGQVSKERIKILLPLRGKMLWP
jgi:hypothetical protein